MELVLITSHFPYEGESFIENEIKYISDYFSKIYIICGEKNSLRKEINTPLNWEVIMVNDTKTSFITYFKSILNLFTLSTIKEIKFAYVNYDSIRLIDILKRIFAYNLNSNKTLYKIIKNIDTKDNMKIYYSYWLSSEAYTLVKLKRKIKNSYCISRAHGYDAFFNRGYQSYRKLLSEKLDEIHFVSSVGLNQFNNVIPNKRNNIYLSKLGTINDSTVHYKELNQTFHILSCSNVIELKRLDLIIEAISYISDFNIIWTHIGSGILLEQIKELASSVLKSRNIEYNFLGQLTNREVKKYYEEKNIDLFLNLSDYEGVPVSMMEALSYGIPILARNVGGNSEIVIDNYNGFLLQSDVTAENIAKIIKLYYFSNEERKQKFYENSKNFWMKNYNAEINYTGFVRSVIARYKASKLND